MDLSILRPATVAEFITSLFLSRAMTVWIQEVEYAGEVAQALKLRNAAPAQNQSLEIRIRDRVKYRLRSG